MRNATNTTLVLLLTLLVGTSVTVGQEKIDLLAGEGLDGWESHLIEDDVKKQDVWSLEDGILKCTGTPLGYLYTKQKFQDFKLSLQWRWAPGTEPGNTLP